MYSIKNPELENEYILWRDYGSDGWQPTGFKTLKEALESEKHYSNWIITKKVNYEIKELA